MFLQVLQCLWRCLKLASVLFFQNTSYPWERRSHFSQKSQSSCVSHLITKILTNKELIINVGSVRKTSLYRISLTVS